MVRRVRKGLELRQLKEVRQTLVREIFAYLGTNGKGTATEIAKAIKRSRTKVALALHRDERFIQFPKKGRDVPFGILVPTKQEGESGSD